MAAQSLPPLDPIGGQPLGAAGTVVLILAGVVYVLRQVPPLLSGLRRAPEPGGANGAALGAQRAEEMFRGIVGAVGEHTSELGNAIRTAISAQTEAQNRMCETLDRLVQQQDVLVRDLIEIKTRQRDAAAARRGR